jgi:hypothetical protein
VRRTFWLLLATFIATAPAWAHRYHYLLSSGAPNSPAIAPVTFSFYWESDTLLFPPAAPLCSTGAINVETLPNYTATVSNPEFTVTSVSLCNLFSNYPVDPMIVWQYQGNTAVFVFSGTGMPGEVSQPGDSLFMHVSAVPPMLPIEELDIYLAPTMSIIDTWTVPVPPRSLCIACTLHVFITAGPVVPAPGTPIEATVGLTDLSGTPVGSPQPVTIVPGQVTSVDFAPGALVSATGLSRRQDVIPVVTLANPLPTSPPLQVTTEVSILKGFGGQLVSGGVSVPPSTLGPQSIGAGQMMRMIAMASSPNACIATLGFATATGSAVGPGTSITLNPGQAQTLDLDPGVLSLKAGQQAIVQPVVQLMITPPPAAVANGAGPVTSVCSVTSEVIDTLTGIALTNQNAFLQ